MAFWQVLEKQAKSISFFEGAKINLVTITSTGPQHQKQEKWSVSQAVPEQLTVLGSKKSNSF